MQASEHFLFCSTHKSGMAMVGISRSSGNLIAITVRVPMKRLNNPIQFPLYGAAICGGGGGGGG